MCASTLLSFHQLYIICQSNNTRFLQSLEGEAYDHHTGKNQAAVDSNEFLDLQSAFSREIENEILNMHESKEINEAESEIAANAAVKELERIGSAENISLVEDAVDVLHSINEAKEDAPNQKKSAKNTEKSDTKNNSIKLEDTEVRKNSRTKNKPIRKQKSKEKLKTNERTRAVKASKKLLKSPKSDILKENNTRSRSSKTDKNSLDAYYKDVKENSFDETENQK